MPAAHDFASCWLADIARLWLGRRFANSPHQAASWSAQSARSTCIIDQIGRGLLAITVDSQSLVSQDDAACAANSAVPLITNALQSANPLNALRGDNLLAANRAQQCLALAMYYEAGFEGRDGRRAVAHVVLKRLHNPAFPHDVCSVLFQRSASNICQFTFACDGAMQRARLPKLWRQTMAEAEAALRGQVYSAVGMATHYHAEYVFPRWAVLLEKVAVIGSHLFYR